jgi:hypothetical protein
MDDQRVDQSSEVRGWGCGPVLGELIANVGLFASWLFLPYSLLLLPVAVFLIWYYWRPRKLQFSLAAMFWVTTFLMMYYGAFIILVLR